MNNNMLGFGKLFAMYNQRTYHKTVQMWTEGVCRYIYEFYRQSIRTLLAFLTEVCSAVSYDEHAHHACEALMSTKLMCFRIFARRKVNALT